MNESFYCISFWIEELDTLYWAVSSISLQVPSFQMTLQHVICPQDQHYTGVKRVRFSFFFKCDQTFSSRCKTQTPGTQPASHFLLSYLMWAECSDFINIHKEGACVHTGFWNHLFFVIQQQQNSTYCWLILKACWMMSQSLPRSLSEYIVE